MSITDQLEAERREKVARAIATEFRRAIESAS